eukprot:s2777_g3.t1
MLGGHNGYHTTLSVVQRLVCSFREIGKVKTWSSTFCKVVFRGSRTLQLFRPCSQQVPILPPAPGLSSQRAEGPPLLLKKKQKSEGTRKEPIGNSECQPQFHSPWLNKSPPMTQAALRTPYFKRHLLMPPRIRRQRIVATWLEAVGMLGRFAEIWRGICV